MAASVYRNKIGDRPVTLPSANTIPTVMTDPHRKAADGTMGPFAIGMINPLTRNASCDSTAAGTIMLL